MQSKKITFIGAGNMTSAIVSGLVKKGYAASDIMATDRNGEQLEKLANKTGINVSTDNNEGVAFADIVILAVKPQIMEIVCKDLVDAGEIASKCFVSIAAGITVERLQSMLGGHEAVVRVMPNTPAAIGAGMSGIYATDSVSKENVEFTVTMMEQVGEAIVVPDESDINTVIAASGSSPAYFFLIAEAMQQEAMNMGIPQGQARQLVQQAMFGSAQMLIDNPDLTPQKLRENVTSKGGTTHEAVVTLQENNMSEIFAKAMRAAVARAEEMANEF